MDHRSISEGWPSECPADDAEGFSELLLARRCWPRFRHTMGHEGNLNGLGAQQEPTSENDRSRKSSGDTGSNGSAMPPRSEGATGLIDPGGVLGLVVAGKAVCLVSSGTEDGGEVPQENARIGQSAVLQPSFRGRWEHGPSVLSEARAMRA